MNHLTLTAAFGEYDRTGMLQKGTVRAEGIDLRILTMPPIEIFHRMSRFPEFDVSEMSMGTHCYLLGAGDRPFVGMPAFPSRVFRHSMVYVNVDAAFLHQVPACFAKGSPRVKRMFPDYKTAEIEFYQRTGIHPIMHCIILRKDIYRQYPWALQSLYKAFCEARQKVVDALSDNGALFAMIPFLPSVMEETHTIFGRDFWPYGVEANRKTLEKLVQYAHQQGLTPRILDVDELFAPIFKGV